MDAVTRAELGQNTTSGARHGRMARGGHGLPNVSPGPYAVSVVTRPQGRRPVAVFYPFGHTTPYGYGMR
jgi:hypothetical protein